MRRLSPFSLRRLGGSPIPSSSSNSADRPPLAYWNTRAAKASVASSRLPRGPSVILPCVSVGSVRRAGPFRRADGAAAAGPNRSDHVEPDRHVVAGGVRVRADLVRLLHQLLRLLARHARQRDVELHVDTESAFRTRADADGGGDLRVVRHLDGPALGGHEFHRADEAG